MKSKNHQFHQPNSGHHFWLAICYLAFLFGFLLSIGKVFSQSASEQNVLEQKAFIFKNRVEYDSAVFYFKKSAEIQSVSGDEKGEIRNKLNIYDIYILQRDYTLASSGLEVAFAEIEKGFKGDIDLEADFSQVKGSYLMATGKTDSAKYYLERSIEIRSNKYGSSDTSLHYAYNKLGNLYLAQSDFDSAYLCHQKALELSLKKRNPVNYLTASSYQNLGIAAHMKGDYTMAESCYSKSLQLKETLFIKNDPALAMIYINLGKFCMDLSNYDLALEYYDKAEKLLSIPEQRDDLLFAHIYLNKGNIYTTKGDYDKSISYLFKALSIRKEILGNNHKDVLSALMDLGFAYYNKGDSLLAIDYYSKAAANKENALIVKAYRNLGNIYSSLNKQDSAAKYYHLSIDYAKKFFSGNSYDLALCYQYYGEFLAKTGDDNECLWYYSQAANIFTQLFGTKNKDLAKVFLLQGKYFFAINEFDNALNKIQAAIVTLLPEFDNLDPKINPSIENIVLDISLPDALNLKAKALELRSLPSNDFEYLNLSLNTINLSISVIEKIRKSYNEEDSQLILNNYARNVIDLGVIVTNKLFTETGEVKYLAEAFQLSEKGQAIILLSALRGLEAQSNNEIPERTQKLEKSLSKDLATYNNLFYQERQKKNPDESKMQIWSDEIFNLRLSHDSILASYKELYPDYFRLKYDYSAISADSVLVSLRDDQAILEYHITDSLVVGFLLTDQKLSVKILGKKTDLTRKLDSLHQNFIRKDYFNSGQKEFEAITSMSADLYDILIRPFEDAIVGKRLIIIPDGELGYLSFDLLLKNKPLSPIKDYKELPWLIKSNPISYSSSATIYFEQTLQSFKEVPGNIIAFAPSYNFKSNERNGGIIDSVMLNLSPLIGTKEEINSISGLFRTKKLFDEKATETYFKEHAGGYGILHLAMHTIIDDGNPLYSKLVFTPVESGSQDDGYLNTYELFSLHLPCHLAVLSACNTGSGKLERGEGIISLARGFFYAGIPSVVMTLWEIEDHSSADLMSIFYENLQKGYPIDIALQQAKISYLKKAGKLQSHPYFWAGYVCIGKTDAISFKPARKPLYIVLIAVTLFILFLVIYFFINRRVFFNKKRY
jgi:CHAT domain-containing protein/tetratricopeptide (TPR) repeat protein